MSNSFTRFQQRNLLHSTATDKGNAAFIRSGYNSTTITCGNEFLTAAVVNEQEKDQAYIYTETDNPLEIGSVWAAKGLHWLVSEEIITIKDVNWHKYLAELCNVQIGDIWGKFSTSSNINTSVKEKSIIISLQHPLLIVPAQSVKFQDVVVINERPWMVQEIDNISHAGLTYCSLIPTTIGKDQTTDGIVEYETETQLDQGLATENEVFIPSNYPVTLKIKDGYFKSDNPSLQILSQSLASVTFSLTPGIAPVTIQYKDENGDIVEKLYTEYIND